VLWNRWVQKNLCDYLEVRKKVKMRAGNSLPFYLVCAFEYLLPATAIFLSNFANSSPNPLILEQAA
jgi:hypothetical protein